MNILHDNVKIIDVVIRLNKYNNSYKAIQVQYLYNRCVKLI